MAEWKVVYKAQTVSEAQRIRLMLTGVGLDVDVWDTNLSAQNPWITYALGGVRVVVPDDQAAEALRIIALNDRGETEAPITDEELTRQSLAQTPPPVRAPQTSKVDPQNLLLTAMLVILGIVFLIGLSKG